MAKKQKNKAGKKAAEAVPENALPQNIVAMGEHIEENKNIYISQRTYKAIHRFTKDKTTTESGGVLVGRVIEEFGKTNIIIDGFIEGKHCEATPTTLKFTHETWEQIHADLQKKYPDEKILGWIHTHPDFGIFLSEYDKFIQSNFFNGVDQIAYVVDPIQHIEGFYFWINGNIERCKGFYVFDKTGTKITVAEEPETEPAPAGGSTLGLKIACAVMAVVMAVMMFMLFTQKAAIDRLENTVQQQQMYLNMIFGQQVVIEPEQSASPDASAEPTQNAGG